MNTGFFSFLVVQNPVALFTLLALLMPLLLYLISKAKPILIKFANIKLIEPLPPKSMRNIRLTEFWLLLLRLLVLLLSILLLAQVMIKPPLIASEEVYVVSHDWLDNSDDVERQQLLSLSSNQVIYLLAENTEPITARQVLNWQKLSDADDEKAKVLSRGTLRLHLEYFSRSLADKTRIKLFVTDRVSEYYSGDSFQKLTISNAIDWQIKPIAVNHQALFNEAMKIVIVYDQDRESNLKYFQQAFKLIKERIAPKLELRHFLNEGLENSSRYQQVLQTQPDWLFHLSSKNIDPNTLVALAEGGSIFVDAKLADANLMLANFITINNNVTDLPTTESLFYQRALPLEVMSKLSDENVSQTIGQNNEVLWQYQGQNGAVLPMLTKSTVTEFNTISKNATNEQATKVAQTQARQEHHTRYIYQLYSRFSPSWSNLLVTKQFPVLLQNLLFEQWRKEQFIAQQTLSQDQIIQLLESPQVTNATTSNRFANDSTELFNSAAAAIAQLQHSSDYWREVLVFLLVLLLALERIVSEMSRTKSYQESKARKVADVLAEKSNAAEVID